MDRHRLRALTRRIRAQHDQWYLWPLRRVLLDARLWSLQRRSITRAFGAGLAICFVPLPLHIPLAALVAVVGRLNVPVMIATTWIVNPLTAVPVYYTAYRIGALALGTQPDAFQFELSWDWLQHGLGPRWQPFLLGCTLCAATAGILGWALLEFIWRRRVRQKYRDRRSVSIFGDDGFA
jgi:uncharacterized protein (DUF2062 family)